MTGGGGLAAAAPVTTCHVCLTIFHVLLISELFLRTTTKLTKH